MKFKLCRWPSGSGRGRQLHLWLAALVTVLVVGASPVALAQPSQPPAAPAAPDSPEAPAAPAVPAAVQAPPAADVPEAPETPDAPEPPAVPEVPAEEFTWGRPVVRVGQDYELAAGERVREVVVVFGSVTIGGEVDRDVVSVMGSIRLRSTARVHGSVVAPLGSITVEDGAVVGRDLVSVLGSVDASPAFHPGGDYVVVTPPGFGRAGEAIVPYFTQGLLWGRLIVPTLGWLWPIIAIIVAVYLGINLLFDRAVRACCQVLVERPLSAFLVGLLDLVLIGPVAFILSVSVIGIPVLPFLVCGLFIAALLGKVAVSRWIGSSIVAEDDPGNKLVAMRSFLIGTAVILVAYMVPVIGIFTFAIGGMFGLGAATLAFSSGLRRENPAPRRVPPPPPAPPAGSAPGYAPTSAFNAPLQSSSVDSVGGDVREETSGGTSSEPQWAPPPPPPPPPPPGAFAGGAAAAAAAVSAGALVAMPKAQFLDRLAAFALDVLLVSVTYSLLDVDSARAFFVLLLGYHVVFWGLKATTVGGIICNLRVVRTDGMPLTYTDALIRGFSSIFSIIALGIGCLWILFDPDNQAWHDRFAGTWVVKVPRSWPV